MQNILQVFFTLLFSEFNLLSLSLCTISRYLNSEAIFLPLLCTSPLLHFIQREGEELGGHRWREVLCLFPSLLAEWISPQMGLYWKARTNLQSNESALEAQGHDRHIAHCTCWEFFILYLVIDVLGHFITYKSSSVVSKIDLKHIAYLIFCKDYHTNNMIKIEIKGYTNVHTVIFTVVHVLIYS